MCQISKKIVEPFGRFAKKNSFFQPLGKKRGRDVWDFLYGRIDSLRSIDEAVGQ